MSAQKAQKNTLFNYFKSPKSSTPTRSTTSTPAAESPKTENGGTPHRPALTPSNGTPTLKVKQGFTPSSQKKEQHKNGSLVWAKLDGYPWWPSIVCLHPVKQVACHSGKVHVQFFDNPPTRSWIHMKLVKSYEGSEHFDRLGVGRPTDDAWDTACKEGDAALKMSQEDRLSLVTTLLPSDEENATTPETPRSRKTKSGPTTKRRRIIVEEDSDDGSADYKPEAIESSSESEPEENNLSDEADEPSVAEDESYEEVDDSRKRKPKAKSVTSTPLNLKSFHASSPATPRSTNEHVSSLNLKTIIHFLVRVVTHTKFYQIYLLKLLLALAKQFDQSSFSRQHHGESAKEPNRNCPNSVSEKKVKRTEKVARMHVTSSTFHASFSNLIKSETGTEDDPMIRNTIHAPFTFRKISKGI